ncbi:aldo/keto reductase [Uruburuella testudinis]|uniref:Aldo/keto reductase n=1 Tax=Uruburuella testudinis TaxID=1282863 RepID=A0ABY4DP62_9NEIS|nr:aldo/keto reductase [Uruburuella testudinis]UOO80840.1 aldo/keto reductase [Uruburuella testudinis]
MATQTLLQHGKLGMGTWKLGDSSATRTEEIAALRYGIERGIAIIDTAEMYGSGRSENLVGEAVAPYPREHLYIISKVLPQNANRRYLEQSLDASLKALQTDYLDMYLYHWRGGTPLAETIDTFEKMAEKGKIKAWGVSNFDLEDMQELLAEANGSHCRANQVLYHLGSRGIEVALKPWQDQRHIPTIAYCPLAQAGALQRGLTNHPAVQQIAAELNISVYQVLLCFTLSQSNMVSIPRTGKPAHMKEIADCLAISLSAEQFGALNQAFPVPDGRVPLDVE